MNLHMEVWKSSGGCFNGCFWFPLKGGTVGSVFDPPRFGKNDYSVVYFRGMTFLPIGGLYNPYHLSGEPETGIERT